MKPSAPQRFCAAAGAVIAALALAGWILGLESLKSVVPGLAAMNPLTALLFLTAGSALALPQGQSFVLPAGLLLGLMGLFRLLSFAGWDLGLDTLLFHRALEAYSPPSRMALNTSIEFLVTGLALVFLQRRGPSGARVSQSLALAGTWLSLFAILAYSYRVPRFYGIGPFLPMALNSAVCFALLSAAILLTRRSEGWMACVSDAGPGGIMSRRILPSTLMVPVFFGFLRLKGQWSGWYDTETGTALYAISLIAIFSGLIWYNASLLGRIELARRASERERDRYARFFSMSVDMFCIADFDGHFQELSDNWESVLGHSKEEMLKRPYLDFIHPEDQQRTSSEAEKNAEGVRTLSFENRYRCKDGSHKWLLWTAKPVPEERLIYAVARDITERKGAEETLRHYAEKLEQANRELDAFSYSVSHDLRAPLRAIDGFSQALLEECTEQLDAQGKSFLDRIRKAAQRMGGLIDDLLSLSRLTRVEMNRSMVPISSLAAAAAKALQTGDPARIVRFTAAPGIQAQGDPNLLRIVLDNLLGNAWKYTAKLPDAAVEFGVAVQADGASAYFVRDNGAGFDMAHAGKLFGAFQRLHSSEEFPGSGIGLATVARIVGRHGGRIWAKGSVDEGATFYFTLGEGGKIK